MGKDTDIREAVQAELSDDPLVDAEDITVGNLGGDVALGGTVRSYPQYLEAAERIRSMGAESVILSLGSQGAVAAFADGIIEATPPRVKAVCPIGAGDALAAGYTWSIQRKSTVAEALRWAVAAGTATARLPGLTFATLADTQETYRRVEVRRAE